MGRANAPIKTQSSLRSLTSFLLPTTYMNFSVPDSSGAGERVARRRKLAEHWMTNEMKIKV